jgi:hypothetical protein
MEVADDAPPTGSSCGHGDISDNCGWRGFNQVPVLDGSLGHRNCYRPSVRTMGP